ncbi:MAG: NUDIX domain-containing protein [Candidatus Azobacteroides sp.]|nr:NUDIX domain-containing protein [Candidatus Azobacteroides sp.]
MSDRDFVKNTLNISRDTFHPGLSVDCVIFGFHEGNLKILLNKFSCFTKWMLPGGFIFKNENIDDTAVRVLEDRTGLRDIYLQQFHTFGDNSRTRLEENNEMLIRYGFTDENERKSHWLMQRFISVGYYALVNYSKVQLKTNADEEIAWFGLEEIPELYSDHNRIIEKALSVIRIQLNNVPIGFELLPEKFTMTELRIIYETILKKNLDRRNFQRKVMNSGYIIKLDEVSKKFGIKTSSLFSFDKKKYLQALKNGLLMMEGLD